MSGRFERSIVAAWNRRRHQRGAGTSGVVVGYQQTAGNKRATPLCLPSVRRTEHIALLGKTGTGKSSLLKHLVSQDIRDRRGFCYFDLHGDAVPLLLKVIAAEEQRTGQDLSETTVIIEPADPRSSVGINILERTAFRHDFVRIGEFTEILRQRWHLSAMGARTEELLRNALIVLVECNLTLLELPLLLTIGTFRAQCLKRVTHAEVRSYFEHRYGAVGEGMQSAMRDPILNRVSAFITDPHFRHIVGQSRSTVSLRSALDRRQWILVNLDKGRLGEHVQTLGALLLAQIKSALFARTSRTLFTLYCDEIQNLVAFDGGFETLLSEARKFGVSICSANQYLDQVPTGMRAALAAIGTHIYFQLSPPDAERVGNGLDAPRSIRELVANLPHREFIMKSGSDPWTHGIVPMIRAPNASTERDLYNRCTARWARPRDDIERDIRQRAAEAARIQRTALDDWD